MGITSVDPIETAGMLREYLREGRQGEMEYMERQVEKRCNPSALCPQARSVICGAISYNPGQRVGRPGEGRWGRVARYAWGRDYHVVVKEVLGRLAETIREQLGDKVWIRRFVDTGPVAEKALAVRAGLGWIGKHGLLLNREMGSWLVLGELFTDLELAVDEPVAEECGSCRRCLEACPTGALVGEKRLDARRCIAYWTIEAKESMPEEIRRKAGEWIFGCDDCQEACPYNKEAIRGRVDLFETDLGRAYMGLDELKKADEKSLGEMLAGTSLERRGIGYWRAAAGGEKGGED